MSSLPRFENPKFSIQPSATPAPTRNEVKQLQKERDALARALEQQAAPAYIELFKEKKKLAAENQALNQKLRKLLPQAEELLKIARTQTERADKLAKQVDKLTKRMASRKAKRKAKRAAKRTAKAKGTTLAIAIRPANPIAKALPPKAVPPKAKRARKPTRRSRRESSSSSSGSLCSDSSCSDCCLYDPHPPPPPPRARPPPPALSESDNYPLDEQTSGTEQVSEPEYSEPEYSEQEGSEYEACEGVYEAGYEAGYEEALASEDKYYEY